MDRRLIDYLPDFLREVREYKSIMKSEQPEVEALWDHLGQLLGDQFVEDASENGVLRLEALLGLSPKGSDTLEERKFRILTRLNERLPYTEEMLDQQLKTLCGSDGYTLQVEKAMYMLIVRVKLSSKSNYYAVESLLKRVAPANLLLDLSLLYNSHGEMKKYTHKQLKSFTHNQLRNEVLKYGKSNRKL